MIKKSSHHGDGEIQFNDSQSRNGNPVTERNMWQRMSELQRQGVSADRSLEIVKSEQAQLQAIVELVEQQAVLEEEAGDVLRESILDQAEPEIDDAADIIFNDAATRVVTSEDAKVVTAKDLQRMAGDSAEDVSIEDRAWAHYEAQRAEPDGTMPKDGERYSSPFQRLIRGCKSEPEFKGMGPYQSRDLMAEIMSAWTEDGDDNPWTNRLGQFSDDPEAEWIRSWEQLRYGLGEGPLDLAMSDAMSKPFHPLRSMSRMFDMYVSLAASLALRNAGIAKLPQDRVAKLLGVSQTMVSNYQKEAVKMGFLEMTKPHVYRPGKSGVCAEFRFALEKFDVNGYEIAPKLDKASVEKRGLKVVGGRQMVQ